MQPKVSKIVENCSDFYFLIKLNGIHLWFSETRTSTSRSSVRQKGNYERMKNSVCKQYTWVRMCVNRQSIELNCRRVKWFEPPALWIFMWLQFLFGNFPLLLWRNIQVISEWYIVIVILRLCKQRIQHRKDKLKLPNIFIQN